MSHPKPFSGRGMKWLHIYISSRLPLLLLSLLIFGCSKGIGVTDIQFGTFSGVGTHKVSFRANTTLLKSQEPIFGWAFSISNPPETLHIREVITGPEGSSWEAPPDKNGYELSDAGRTVSITKTISHPGSLFMFHHFAISATDPSGPYSAKLFLNNKLVKEVSFVVSD